MGSDTSVRFGLILTPVLIAAGQVLFRMAGLRLRTRAGKGILSIITDPYLLLALSLYAVATLLWVYVLSRMPLRQAYPAMAFTYLLVPIASMVVLNETIAWSYWAGATMVVLGVAVMATST